MQCATTRASTTCAVTTPWPTTWEGPPGPPGPSGPPGPVGPAGGVTGISPGSLTGEITLVPGANVGIAQSGNTIVISASGGGGGGQNQTPWPSTINASTNQLINVGAIGIGGAASSANGLAITTSDALVSAAGGGISITRYTTGEPWLYFHHGRGTQASPQPVVVGDWIGYIGWGGQVSNFPPNNRVDGAELQCIVTSVTPTGIGADLAFFTNDGTHPTGSAYERMRIAANGKVNIGGNWAPISAQLVVNATASPGAKADCLFLDRYGNDAVAPDMFFWKDRAATPGGTSVPIQVGDALMYIGWGGYSGAGGPDGGAISAYVTAVSGTDYSCDLVFGTHRIGGGGGWSMTIAPEGYVGVNCYPAYPLDVAGDLRITDSTHTQVRLLMDAATGRMDITGSLYINGAQVIP